MSRVLTLLLCSWAVAGRHLRAEPSTTDSCACDGSSCVECLPQNCPDCRWCELTLRCIQSTAAPNACYDRNFPKQSVVIGHAGQCIGDNAPWIQTVNLTHPNGAVTDCWDGVTAKPCELPTNGTAGGQWMLAVSGDHWGYQAAAPGPLTTPAHHQSLSLCPPDTTRVYNSSMCFECDTEYIVDGVSNIQYRVEVKKTVFASRFLCRNLTGIGSSLGVYMRVAGEPLSVVVNSDGHSANMPLVITVQFPAPVVTSVVHAETNSACSSGNPCEVKAGDTLVLCGRNFPMSDDVIKKYNAGFQSGDGLIASVGAWVCATSQLVWGVCGAHPGVECTVPAGAGTLLDLSLTVGGQPTHNSSLFSYSPPAIISPLPPLYSYGGAITLVGTGFGPSQACSAQGAGVVTLQRPAGAAQCQVSAWNDTTISCNSGVSGSWDMQLANVSVSIGNQTSMHPAIQRFEACTCNQSIGGVCWFDGQCSCNGNWKLDTQEHGTVLCSCPNSTCQHGGTLNHSSCSCSCIEAWVPSPTPGFPNTSFARPTAVGVSNCGLCELSCPGLHKVLQASDPSGADCHCVFNQIHLVWMIGLPLVLVLVLLGFLGRWFISKRREQHKHAPLLKPEDEDALEEEEEAGGDAHVDSDLRRMIGALTSDLPPPPTAAHKAAPKQAQPAPQASTRAAPPATASPSKRKPTPAVPPAKTAAAASPTPKPAASWTPPPPPIPAPKSKDTATPRPAGHKPAAPPSVPTTKIPPVPAAARSLLPAVPRSTPLQNKSVLPPVPAPKHAPAGSPGVSSRSRQGPSVVATPSTSQLSSPTSKTQIEKGKSWLESLKSRK